MPSKKRKYNARFPAGRIKKIMQTDEDVGKVAQAVPVIISRTLELFVESLLMKAMQITNAKNAKTLSPSHMKQCILSESRFDFLKDLVKNIPDINNEEGRETECDLAVRNISPLPSYPANFYTEQSTSSVQNTASVIQYSRKTQQNPANEKPEMSNLTNISSNFNLHQDKSNVVRIDIPPLVPINQEDASCISSTAHSELDLENNENGLEQNKIPPLAPIVQQVQDIHHYGNQTDNLCIDEDYDN